MGSMWQPLLLTLLGAAGTALGGLLVVLQPNMSFVRLGALQGLAAGLMLSISLIDLLPEAAEEIGFIPANLCFYAGVAFFAAVVALIPEPSGPWGAPDQPPAAASNGGGKLPSSPYSAAAAAAQPPRPQHAAAAGGGSAPDAAGEASPPAGGVRARRRSAAAPAGPAGAGAPAASRAPARLDTSSAGLQPADHAQQQQQQQPHGGPPSTPASSVSDAADLQVVLREHPEAAGDAAKEARRHKQQLLMSGLITAVGIALHNAPEGVAVYLAAHKSTAVGISLAAAIALHNIPEGVAVALPVYFATGSRWRGFCTAALSGLAEPLAVLLLGAVFPFLPINKHVVDGMLAGVGGIMAFLAFHELLPLAVQHAGKGLAVGCLFGGMCLMSVTLHVLNTHVLAGLH